jgi:hypothetical protein
MPNTILTHQMVAREAAAMFEEEGTFIKNINRDRESDIDRDVSGYTSGTSVKIKIPPTPVVYNGASFAGGGSAPDQNETFETLTVDTQKHVPLTFTATQKAMELADFKERFLRPAIQALVSTTEADLMVKAYREVPASLGTAGTVPTTIAPFAAARGAMNRQMAPMGKRFALVSSDVNTNMVAADRVLFRPDVADQYTTGSMGDTQGFKFFENQSLPVHTNGTQASWTINGAGQTGSTLNIGGLTATQTILRGTTFTIPAVREVHPITGAPYPAANLRTFVVTADFTAAGTTGSINIWPPITPTTSSLVGTVNASPANGATCTMFGAASSALRQNLTFHRDAFAAAFVPLPVLASCEGYTFKTDNFAIRVMTFGNGQSDTESTRIDVLYGFSKVRAGHAARVSE